MSEEEVILPEPIVQADATERTTRTIAQGLISVVLVAVLPIVYFTAQDGVEHVNWSILGYSAATAATVVVVTYLMAILSPSTVLKYVVAEAVQEADTSLDKEPPSDIA